MDAFGPMLPFVTMSDDKRAIEEVRQEMAKVDAQLLGLLDRRAKLARSIGKLRGEGAPQVPAESRTQLAALVARATGDMPADSIRDIFREVHAACSALELGVVVAFVGAVGSSGYGAARKRFGGPTKLLPFDSAEEAVREVVAQRASFAVLPLETKTDGLVQHTLTALISSELKLVATFEAVPSVHLVNRTGNLADVEKVYAAPFERQACKAFFAANPRLQVLEVASPELACQRAHEDDGSAALADEVSRELVGRAEPAPEESLHGERAAKLGVKDPLRDRPTRLAFAAQDAVERFSSGPQYLTRQTLDLSQRARKAEREGAKLLSRHVPARIERACVS